MCYKDCTTINLKLNRKKFLILKILLILEAELIEKEEWNKQEEEDNEGKEKSYYVKEMVCVNDDTLIEYKRRTMEF